MRAAIKKTFCKRIRALDTVHFGFSSRGRRQIIVPTFFQNGGIYMRGLFKHRREKRKTFCSPRDIKIIEI